MSSSLAPLPLGPPAAAHVGEATARYAEALDALDATATDAGLAGGLFAAASARDAVARALAGDALPSAEALRKIAALDARLRERAARSGARVDAQALADWRAALQPPPAAWWWSLDTLAAPAREPHPLWPVLAGALIALAVSLATDISLRFLSGGPDLLGLFGTFTQAALALLAGSAFTRVGGEKVEQWLHRLHVARSGHPAWKTLLSAALLLVVVGLWSALPAVARLYNDHGVRLLARGEIAAARDAFERAVRLHSSYPQARYNLAVAYEEMLDHDLAIGEYQRAIRLDERLYAAYTNLARLYLLRKGDGASALALVERGLALNPKEPDVMYSLLKNRGWAQLLLGHLLQAEEGLKQAIALRVQRGAAAHCLLAQVLEKQRTPSDAQKQAAAAAWAQCVALAPDKGEVVEPAWLSLAEERLRGATP